MPSKHKDTAEPDEPLSKRRRYRCRRLIEKEVWAELKKNTEDAEKPWKKLKTHRKKAVDESMEADIPPCFFTCPEAL